MAYSAGRLEFTDTWPLLPRYLKKFVRRLLRREFVTLADLVSKSFAYFVLHCCGASVICNIPKFLTFYVSDMATTTATNARTMTKPKKIEPAFDSVVHLFRIVRNS